MIVVVRIVQEKAGVGDAVFGLDDRVVNLRNAHEENAVSGAHHQRPRVAERVGKSRPRRKVIRLERNLARRRKQRVRDQSYSGKRLQVPAHAQIHGQVIRSRESYPARKRHIHWYRDARWRCRNSADSSAGLRAHRRAAV